MTRSTLLYRPANILLSVALIAVGPLAAIGALAQDAPSVPQYSVAIYQGACDTPAVEPSFLLGTTYAYGADPEDDDEDLELRGGANVEPVATVEETLDTTFETLLDQLPHIVAVHEGEVTPEGIVACGELGGIVDDGRLVVGLRPLGEAGVAGIAILDEDTAGFLGIGEDQVNVRVYLLDGLTVGAPGAATPAPDDEAAPAAPTPDEEELDEPTPTEPANGTPAADAEDGQAAATEVTVEMVDIDFNPNEFTIPANTDVTVELPNNGASVHNFVIDELGIHSGDVQPGDSTTVTINAEPGEYTYYCDIPGHREAGMVGTLVVEEQ